MKKTIISSLLIVPTTMITLALTQSYVAHADDSTTQSNTSSSSSDQSSINNSSGSGSSQNSDSSQSNQTTTDQSNSTQSSSEATTNNQDNNQQSTNNQSNSQSSDQNNNNQNTNNQNNNGQQGNNENQNNNSQQPNNNNNNNNNQPVKPEHKYNRVISTKKVNFDTIIKKTTNIYKGGAYNTKESNIKKSGNSSSLKHKWIHVSELQTTKTGTYAHIFHNQHDKGWINKDAFDNTAFKLNGVPLISQLPQLPTGCEITAVTMMVNYATGKKYSKTYMANRMPRSSNPNKGFVGNPYSKSGWYIYPPALMKLVKHYTGSSVNLTGKSVSYLKNYIQKHQRPIVMYVANVDGFPNHALTVTGFTKDRIYYNDPWTNKRTSMNIKSITIHHNDDGKRAIGY
ncbi:C39 family peptidase [Lactobacillaceae bacterium Melli_B4]